MADSFFNEERVDELKEAFKLKAGGDDAMTAKLKVSDLGPLLEAIGLPPLSVAETFEMEGQADPNSTGYVEFAAFLEVLKAKFAPPFNDEKLEKAFSVLRNPANKRIHVDEICHFLLAYNAEECNQDAVSDFSKNIPLAGKDVDIDKFVKELLG
eukprot:185967_1